MKCFDFEICLQAFKAFITGLIQVLMTVKYCRNYKTPFKTSHTTILLGYTVERTDDKSNNQL